MTNQKQPTKTDQVVGLIQQKGNAILQETSDKINLIIYQVREFMTEMENELNTLKKENEELKKQLEPKKK